MDKKCHIFSSLDIFIKYRIKTSVTLMHLAILAQMVAHAQDKPIFWAVFVFLCNKKS